MGKRNRSNNNIPDGWQGCPSMGTGFVDGRFFVFKTPLNPDLNKKVPLAERFTIDTIFHQLEQMNNSRIGLWIDLTNTSRYYCPTQVQHRGVHFEKLSCEGHGKPPSGRTISAFCNMVNYFFRRNRHDYVGVHCTHGFNRTGYLICCYLIRYRKYTAAEAIQEFSRHRQPGIYRQFYINHLYTMSFPLEMPIQVSEPEWLSEQRYQLHVPAFQQAQLGSSSKKQPDKVEDDKLVAPKKGATPGTSKRLPVETSSGALIPITDTDDAVSIDSTSPLPIPPPVMPL